MVNLGQGMVLLPCLSCVRDGINIFLAGFITENCDFCDTGLSVRHSFGVGPRKVVGLRLNSLVERKCKICMHVRCVGMCEEK